LYQNVNIY